MSDIKWQVTRGEHELIADISRRAYLLVKSTDAYLKPEFQREVLMDVTATHANGCRLRLRELLVAPPFDFLHDVLGIRRHIDRTTGKLTDCFLPRFSA